MKKLLTIFLITISMNGLTQDIFGKWYVVNRSGLIEFKISKDSILTSRLFSDLKPKGGEGESKILKSIIPTADKVLLITTDRRDANKYSAIVIFDIKKDETFKVAWNVRDTATTDVVSLINFHRADKKTLFGATAYSEKYLATLNQMKRIDQMTLDDFKHYAKVYVDKIHSTSSESDKFIKGYAAITYNFQLITQSLFDCGFNPIENTLTVEAVYKKYYDEPDVKTIFEGGRSRK